MARILLYCMNGTGLGHVTRILAISRQLRRLAPETEILVLTSSEHSGILWQEKIVSVKIPSQETLVLNQDLPIRHLASSITAQVFATFQPDIVVVDSAPQGAFSELLSLLSTVPNRIFLYGNFPNMIKQPAYKIAINFYDRVIMPYNEDEQDTLPVKDSADGKLVWTGDILVRSGDEIFPRDVASQRLGLGDWKEDELTAYVGLGGGGNAKNSDVRDWALDVLSEYPDIRIACAAQPLSDDIENIFQRDNCIPINHFPMVEYYSAFDFCISAVGFNSAEAIHAGLPAIWVPFRFPATDQEFNADRFANADLGVKVMPLDTEALRTAIESMRDAKYRRAIQTRMRDWAGPNGAELAAKSILELAAS
ncbi:MAG: hypothetical protein HN578_20055 [Rhodospirillales bacterium]|jgi:UDP-N-acetylglucosamine--N-acetylmuramyl-(pentapeptide) pyrophosphoryl-undecaprenol N-acetylglucosamine transferase|nr:hypothetical protein [Rhodospirillales bacterium]